MKSEDIVSMWRTFSDFKPANQLWRHCFSPLLFPLLRSSFIFFLFHSTFSFHCINSSSACSSAVATTRLLTSSSCSSTSASFSFLSSSSSSFPSRNAFPVASSYSSSSCVAASTSQGPFSRRSQVSAGAMACT